MDRSLQTRRAEHLVTTDWLASHLDDSAVRIVDMRGVVKLQSEPDGSRSSEYLGVPDQYAVGHIPGAVYLDWTQDIADLGDPVPAQVAPPDKIARVLGEAGIGDDTLVIAYDSHPAVQFATRLWWVLRYYGHDSVRVLDGGWGKWIREGRPVNAESPVVTPQRFTPRIRPELRTTADQVAAQIGNQDSILIDARDEGQFLGKIRRGPRGGHIPGALHLPREKLIGDDGCFLPPELLRSAVDSAGVKADHRCIAYCNGGVAATSVLFALSMLGFPRLANYDGSWNEWSRRSDLPTED